MSYQGGYGPQDPFGAPQQGPYGHADYGQGYGQGDGFGPPPAYGPGFAQQPGQPMPYGAPPQPEPDDAASPTLGIVSMLLGVLSFVLVWVEPIRLVAMIAGVLAVVVAVFGIVQRSRTPFAITGLAAGVAAFGVWLAWTLVQAFTG